MNGSLFAMLLYLVVYLQDSPRLLGAGDRPAAGRDHRRDAGHRDPRGPALGPRIAGALADRAGAAAGRRRAAADARPRRELRLDPPDPRLHRRRPRQPAWSTRRSPRPRSAWSSPASPGWPRGSTAPSARSGSRPASPPSARSSPPTPAVGTGGGRAKPPSSAASNELFLIAGLPGDLRRRRRPRPDPPARTSSSTARSIQVRAKPRRAPSPRRAPRSRRGSARRLGPSRSCLRPRRVARGV